MENLFSENPILFYRMIFFQHMRAAGYTDVERGERDSTEEHLTVTQFKVAQEKSNDWKL